VRRVGRARWGAIFALPLLAAPIACPRGPAPAKSPRAPCASLGPSSCETARALTVAAATYADELHDDLLAGARVSSGTTLARTAEGWRVLPVECARARRSRARIDPGVVDYAFVGVAVDATLVSADADIGPLLARSHHDVRLVAIAFVRDLAPPSFDRGASLVETPSGGCSCGEAAYFAGATKYGAMVSFAFDAPPGPSHVRALDFVSAALGDARRGVRESRIGSMTIDGLPRFLRGEAAVPLAFHVTDPQPIAFAVSSIAELCDFPAPEVSPSPLDFGVAPYGTEAHRSVHVVNRAPFDLEAILGSSTFVLPASGAIDIPLRWTPDGDAPGCETQTRDEAIPFARVGSRAGGGAPRAARVLETIRTGRPTVARTERVELARPKLDLASTVRDWTCPRDFVRTSCRAENVAPRERQEAIAEPRGEDACHFACPAQILPDHLCRFDAVMECALHCPP
jgi:hypothetical protein